MNTNFEIRKNIENLKQRLYFEVKEYYDKERENESLEPRIALLREIVSILDKDIEEDDIVGLFILLESAFPEDLYKFYENKIYDYILSKNKLKDNEVYYQNELEKTNNNYNSIKSNINNILLSETLKYRKNKAYIKENKSNIISYKKVISDFKYNILIGPNERAVLNGYFRKNNLSVDKTTLFLEIIRDHNLHINNPTRKIRTDAIEMCLAKHKHLDVEYSYDNEKLNDKIENYILLIETEEFAENIEGLPKLTRGEVNLKEYDYIYRSILNALVDKMNDLRNDLFEVYGDIELRKLVINDYLDEKNRYNLLYREYMVDKEKYIKKEQLKEEIENIDNNVCETRNILFMKNGDKVYLENDLKDIPEEYYERVYNLIKNFRDYNLNKDNIRQLTSNSKFKSFRELRDDQIRIVFKEIGNNNYLILGAGVKKDNVDIKLLTRLTKRYRELSQEEIDKLSFESYKYFNDIHKFVLEKGRKGNR